MASKLVEIEKEISLLSIKDRAYLAKNILLGLDKEEDDEEKIEQLWIEEAKKRSMDYKSGKIKSRPVKDFLNDLDRKFQ
jgi:hypothetical protein